MVFILFFVIVFLGFVVVGLVVLRLVLLVCAKNIKVVRFSGVFRVLVFSSAILGFVFCIYFLVFGLYIVFYGSF